MEAADLILIEQEGDDMLHVGALGVMAQIHQHLVPIPQLIGEGIGHAPIRQIRVVEGGFEHLVFDQQAHIGVHGVHGGLEGVHEPMLAGANVPLAGVIGAVGQPQGDGLAVGLAGDFHALEHMVHGLGADAGVGVGEGAELIIVVLEQVGVYRADGQAQGLGVGLHLGIVVALIPGDVDRHRGAHARNPVYPSGVVQLLLQVAGHAQLLKGFEPGSGIPEAPGGQLHLKGF